MFDMGEACHKGLICIISLNPLALPTEGGTPPPILEMRKLRFQEANFLNTSAKSAHLDFLH